MEKFKAKIKAATLEELQVLRGILVGRAETRRVALSRTGSSKASEQYSKTRKELGLVNTEIHLRS